MLLLPTRRVAQELCFNWRGNTASFDPNVALLDFSQSCQQQTSERALETLPRPKKPQPTASGRRRRLQFQNFFSCLFFSNCVESRHRTSFMLLSKFSESRSAPMNLEIIQCRKHVFPVDPEGIFPRTKDCRVQAALPYQQQAVVHIGGKI